MTKKKQFPKSILNLVEEPKFDINSIPNPGTPNSNAAKTILTDDPTGTAQIDNDGVILYKPL